MYTMLRREAMDNFKEWLIERFTIEKKDLTVQEYMLIRKEQWHIIPIRLKEAL